MKSDAEGAHAALEKKIPEILRQPKLFSADDIAACIDAAESELAQILAALTELARTRDGVRLLGSEDEAAKHAFDTERMTLRRDRRQVQIVRLRELEEAARLKEEIAAQEAAAVAHRIRAEQFMERARAEYPLLVAQVMELVEEARSLDRSAPRTTYGVAPFSVIATLWPAYAPKRVLRPARKVTKRQLEWSSVEGRHVETSFTRIEPEQWAGGNPLPTLDALCLPPIFEPPPEEGKDERETPAEGAEGEQGED
jgi:hypothetical protein